MKIILRYCGVNARDNRHGSVKEQWRRLQGLAANASARVTLETQHEAGSGLNEAGDSRV